MGYTEFDLADVEGVVFRTDHVPKRFPASYQIICPANYGELELTPIVLVTTRAGASAIRRWFVKAGCENVHVYFNDPVWQVEFWERTD